MANFSLDNFKSEVLSKSGLARVNRFEIQLNPPIAPRESAVLTSLYCEVANFPPLTLFVKPFKIFGPTYQRPTTSEYGGDGMSMTFHMDRNMNIKRMFDDWLEFIVDKNTFTVRYQDEYARPIQVRQLDEQNNVMYEITLIDAFPRSITLMDLNMSAQNQTHRLNVIFAYRYWRRTDPIADPQPQPQPVVKLQTLPVIYEAPPLVNRFNWDPDQGGVGDYGTFNTGSDLPVSA